MLAEAMSAGEQAGQTPFSAPFIPPGTAGAAAPVAAVAPPAAEAPPVPGACAGERGVDPTLPPRYAGFYQLLITRTEWDVKDIDGLARREGLMLSGAIDALNEWAAEKYGGQLFVEDGGRILVEQAYLN